MAVIQKIIGRNPDGTPRRDRWWWVGIRVRGRLRWKRVGPDKRVAKALEGKWLAARQEGRFFEVEALRERIRLAPLATQVVAQLTEPGSRSRQEHTWRVARLATYFGDRYLDELGGQEVDRFIAFRRAAGTTNSTINRDLQFLKMVVRKAVEWNYLVQNPLAGVKLLKENPWRLRYLQPGELRALLASAHARLRPILILGVWTGLRLGELLQLAWDDVDVEHQRLLVRGRTKNREPRSVPLLGGAVEALKQIPTHPDCPYLFWHQWRGKIRRVRPRLVQEWFATARVAAGIHNVRLHDLRHTYGSYLAVLGTPSKVIQELLGHKSLRMTERYMHIAPQDRHAAVARLDDKLSLMLKSRSGVVSGPSGRVTVSA